MDDKKAWLELEKACKNWNRDHYYKSDQPYPMLDADPQSLAITLRIFNSYSIKDQLRNKKFRFDGGTKAWKKEFKDFQSAVSEAELFL